MAVWTVKGGRHGEREERCLEHGVVGGGWEQIPDLSNVDSRDALSTLCEQAAADWSPKTRSNYVAQLWSLRERMQLDELVVLPLKTTGTIAVGRVSGSYAYRQDLGEDFRHARAGTRFAASLKIGGGHTTISLRRWRRSLTSATASSFRWSRSEGGLLVAPVRFTCGRRVWP
jgi:hypothetical protein